MPLRLRRSESAFTLIELLTVIAIILILVGISFGTFSYANTKAARSRAEAEIKALAVACENYKIDQGEYPRRPATGAGESDSLDAAGGNGRSGPNPSGTGPYESSSLLLYRLLSGKDADGATIPNGRSYFEFKPKQLNTIRDMSGQTTVRFITDPWGNSYGYSTARFYDSTIANPTPTTMRGNNPTVDLWSTGGRKTSEYNTPQTANALWIKNW